MKALISLSCLVFGLSLGSLALPKDIAKIGFYSADRDGRSLVIPGESGGEIQASQIGTILDRVMMLSDLELETDEYAKLPSGMVLNPPDLGILIFVDGIPPNGKESMPFLQNLLQSSSSIGIQGDMDDGRLSNTGVLASAMGPQSRLSPTSCLELRSLEGSSKGLGCAAACSTVTSFTSGNIEPKQSLKILGIDIESLLPELNMLPIAENLNLLASLFEIVKPRSNDAMAISKQEVVALHLSLASLSESDTERSKLESVMDQAIARTVYKLSETSISRGVQPNIVVEFVAGLDLASPSTETGSPVRVQRKSMQIPTRVAAATSSGDVNLVDIVQYQLNLWTGVFLVVGVMVAVGMIAFMDVGRDSLLYAKFSMNTQDLKND